MFSGAVWRSAVLLGGLLGASSALAAPNQTQALRTGLERSSQTLKVLDGEVSGVERFYSGVPSIIGVSSFEQKLGEGQIFLALGAASRDRKNFERAAIVLFDLVEGPQFKDKSGYDDALFSLAEALFALELRYGARDYYRRVAERNAVKYHEPAIVRLIELASLLDNYDGLDEYYKKYEEIARGEVRPAVRYARGKILARRGRHPEAEAELSKVPVSDPYGIRALYLRGVGLIKQGQLEDAVTRFKEAAVATAVAPEDKHVKELANMARGRLYYELGQLAESADAYQEIDTASPLFPEMLYEVAWTFVKRGQSFKDQPKKAEAEYRKSVEALDLLLISNTNKKLESEVRILRGNLLMRLGQPDEAERAFQQVVDDYSATLKTLDEQMTARGNTEQILAELLRREAKTVNVDNVLPPLVQQWAQGDDGVIGALGVFTNIEGAKVDVSETRELAEKLLKYLDAPNRLDLFPALQEGRARALAAENSVLLEQGRLADLQSGLVGQRGEDAAAADFRAAREARTALYQKLQTLPRTSEQLEARKQKLTHKITDVEKALFRMQLDVDNIQAQTAAMDAAVRDKKTAGSMTPAEDEYWKTELLQVGGALEQLRALEKELKTALKAEKDGLTMSGGADSQESVIRTQYREALEREFTLGREMQAGSDPAVAGMWQEMEARKQKSRELMARLDGFNRELRTQVDGQASEMRGVVILERTRVSEYEKQVGAYEGEAGEMAAVLTRNALKGVRDQFFDVVLRADVGLIDLAWQEKQDRTDAVSTLVRKQKVEMKSLEDEFADVMKDVE